MARIRTVKPELFRHEELYKAEKESCLPLRLAFIGLFTVCDREGRFKWSPGSIKLDILPYDEIDIAKVLDTLVDYGFVVKYGLADRFYGCILSFPKHQVINNREKDSELPEYSQEFDASSTRAPRVKHATTTPLIPAQGEGKGREGNKEGEGKELRVSAHAFTKPGLDALITEFTGKVSNPLFEATQFLNHFNSNGWKVGGKAPMKSWQSAVATWAVRSNGHQAAPKLSKQEKLEQHNLEVGRRWLEKQQQLDEVSTHES